MKRLKPIMFVGTGSDVGKSVVNAGFCRIFKQDGYSPAPFKAQNMSNNSYATLSQGEIGRAQAVQAEACGVECSVEMNPVLLKPTNNCSSQVVLNGKPIGNRSAKEYFRAKGMDTLFEDVTVAFDRLNSRYSPIVLEGAGSISEMNLWSRDIVNMRMAKYANAATYLIADIDKGGVFASVYGSIMLLPEDERKLIKGVIINKFRGDMSLFEDGRKMLEELTGVKVVGVIPYFRDVFIEQEDSVVIDRSRNAKSKGGDSRVAVGVVLLKSMSNFTDFNMLSSMPMIDLFYAATPEQLAEADVIIIPGSKNTIADMIYIRESGLEEVILAHHNAGKPLYGICGGYQMMGERIDDYDHIEGDIETVKGLGILPVSTRIEGGKVTRRCGFTMVESGVKGVGYEIHSGVSSSDRPLATLESGESDGYYESEKCWGSYIHGVFDNREIIAMILSIFDIKLSDDVEDYAQMKERNYDLLASYLRESVDMDYIYKTLEL